MYLVTKQLKIGSRCEWVRMECLLLGLAPPTTYREPCGPSFMKALGIISKHLMTSCLLGGLACLQAFRASNSTGASLWLVVIGWEIVLRYGGVGAKVGKSQAKFEGLGFKLGSLVSAWGFGLHRSIGNSGGGRRQNIAEHAGLLPLSCEVGVPD